MGLETPTWVSDLNAAWPIGASDPRSQGDDHLRAIKSALQTTFPNATKAFYFPIVTNVSSSPYALPSTDRNVLLRVDASAGAITITLPAAATMVAGAQVRVSRVAGANTITVDPNGAELVNGAATVTVGPTVYDALILECTGTAWTAYAAVTPIPGAGSINEVNIRVFTANGTYTPTAGMLYCIAECVGSGGGGGGAAELVTQVGGGGGAGGYARRVLSAAQVGASQALTVPAGGAGGASTGGNGGNGSSTFIGALLGANGGVGGTGNAVSISDAYGVSGGAGGAGTVGAVLINGGNGLPGLRYNNVTRTSGSGGSSMFGIGGQGSHTNAVGDVITGNAGSGRGSGGAGGVSSSSAGGGAAGGAGTGGYIVITEFIST